MSQNDSTSNTSWSADKLVDKWNDFKDMFIDISKNCAPTVSRLQPDLATVVDGGESELFWRGSNSTCCFNFTTTEQVSVKKMSLGLTVDCRL